MSAESTPLRAGAGVVDITPPLGLDLSGGAFGPADKILYPLRGRALFLEQGPVRLLLLGCDLLGFGRAYADEIRIAVATALQMPLANVMLTATHTHCAPATMFLRYWGREDEGYKQKVEQALVDVSRRAAAAAVPATIGAGTGRCPGVGVNRTSYSDLVDDTLVAARVESVEGDTIAGVVNFGCHPVNMHQSGVVSPDFPYHLERRIQATIGDVPVLYFTGPSGDINPANFDFASIRDGQFSVDDLDGLAAETGRAIAETAVSVLGGVADQGQTFLAASAMSVSLPLMPLPTRRELVATMEQAQAAVQDVTPSATDWEYARQQTVVDWAQAALKAIEAGTVETERAMELSCFIVGPLLLLGIPGELFTLYGTRIREAAGSDPLMIATLANGGLGYIAVPEAFARDAYEAVYCPRHLGLYGVDATAGELIVQTSAELLEWAHGVRRSAVSPSAA